MADSCCLCGVILATDDGDFPRWCKELRALYLSDGMPVLSCIGYVDDDVEPYSFGPKRFCYRRTSAEIEELEDYCYPFHASCWSLLRENNGGSISRDEVDILFTVFESFHYDRSARALQCSHRYGFEDVLESFPDQGTQDPRKSVVAMHKEDMALLADPLHFSLCEDEILGRRTVAAERHCLLSTARANKIALLVFVMSFAPILRLRHLPKLILAFMVAHIAFRRVSVRCIDTYFHRRPVGHDCLLNLPPEVFECILSNLDLDDVQRLLKSSAGLYKRYGRGGVNLPSSFWESRFWPNGEMAFARGICPPMYSWKQWVFAIKSQLKAGRNSMNLRNRKRIWKVVAELNTLVYTINRPDCTLRSRVPRISPQEMTGPTASCLASKHDTEGCRELKGTYVSLGDIDARSRFCAMTQSYISVFGQKLLSGLTITFDDGQQVDAGYITRRDRHRIKNLCDTPSPRFLWVVFSPLGFLAMTFDTCPQAILDSCNSSHHLRLAVARWSWDSVQGIYLGLDAMRIVRITIDSPGTPRLDDLSWTCPRPSLSLSINKDDLIALHELQRNAFTPASTICLDPMKGQLSVVIVHSALGRQAGIAGIRYIYDTGLESVWGTSVNTASLAFFLDDSEQLIKVKVYKIGSLVFHLQFFTNFHRSSDISPQPQMAQKASMDCVEHVASGDGYIVGFCGCFLESSRQLNCFGTSATTCSIASTLPRSIPDNKMSLCAPLDPSLGSIRNHGIQRSYHLMLERYDSVQAFMTPAASDYRKGGQIIGLAFCRGSYPELLGQWTASGKTYYFEAGEQILDLEITTLKPGLKRIVRPGLSQVESITIVTNLRRIRYRSNSTSSCERKIKSPGKIGQKITEVYWDFNAVFDRIQCIYQ